MKKFMVAVLLSQFVALTIKAEPLTVGQSPSIIKLEGKTGGKVTGEGWTSEDFGKAGKMMVLFYIDPEEKKHNEAVEEAFQKEKFPFEKLGSVAIINMAAAWYPNSMIDSNLKTKQEKFPRTVYVKDLNKALVKDWDLKDDSVNVVLFGVDGKPLYIKRGPMSDSEITELMKLIRSKI